MNGTIENKLRSMLLVLGAALALVSVGCAQQSSPDDDADDDESVAVVHQEVDPASLEQQLLIKGGPTAPGGNVSNGDTQKDPQPQPWKPNAQDDRSSPPGTGDPADDDHPFVKTTSTPSGGHHDN